MDYSTRLNLEVACRRHVLRLPHRTTRSDTKAVVVSSAEVQLPVRAILESWDIKCTTISPDELVNLDAESQDVVLGIGALNEAVDPIHLLGDMRRVCSHEGLVVTIDWSEDRSGPEMSGNWRVLPHALASAAQSAELELMDSWRDERGPRFDVIGVFRRRGGTVPLRNDTPSFSDLGISPTLQNAYPSHEFPEREMTQGAQNYRRLLGRMHPALEPRFYLEIGVESGRTLAAATGPAVGIDPAPVLELEMPSNCTIALETSDDFFDARRESGTIAEIDYAFIDGMHVFENVLMDFMNVERHASSTSLIVVDDVLPNHPVQAYRKRETQHWTGDVWKIIPILRKYRPDLLMLHINTAPTGLLFVLGSDSSNRVLWDNFDAIIEEALEEIGDPPAEFLYRHNALDPEDPLLDRVFGTLRGARSRGNSVDIEFLRELVQGAHPRVIASTVS